MIERLYAFIIRLDQQITRDRAEIIAMEQRIEVARRKKAMAQRMLARQRS